MSSRPSLVAHIRALPGSVDAVAELLGSLAEDVRREPGNVLFEAHQLREDQAEFLVYEVYRDEAAFREHMVTEHGRVFNAAITDLVEGGQSRLTWLTPIRGD
jgi:quinol monooxygenase YgiN